MTLREITSRNLHEVLALDVSETHEQRTGALPADLDDTETTVLEPRPRDDAWGRAIRYEIAAPPHDDRFRVCSPGPDRKWEAGGDDRCWSPWSGMVAFDPVPFDEALEELSRRFEAIGPALGSESAP